MLILFDTAHAKLCALTNYRDLYIEKVISGTGSSNNITLPQLHFKYALEDPANGKITLECYIAFATDDGCDDAEYIIKERNLKTDANGGITWVEYVCDLNVEPLKGTLIDNFTPGSVPPDQAVNLALAGTGWGGGYCDVTRRRTAAKSNCTVFEAIEDIAKAYSCEITFDSVNRLVNIHQKQGADRGVYFAEQLNLKSLEVQANSRSYVTRLYPRGKDGLTITDVNGGVPYVSNYQYSTKIISTYWIDNRYTNAADLLADAQERVDYLSKPLSAYAGQIIDLARVSGKWNLLDFRIGDWITLVSESTGVREQQRIVKIDRYPDEPEKSSCEIANRLASLDDIILRVSDAADTVDAATDSTGAVQGSAVKITNLDGTYSNLNATVANIGTLIATKASITNLTAANGRIDSLVSTKADITYLQTNYLTADSVKATYATIANVQATYATINSLSAATGDVSKLKTDKLDAATAAITYATVSSLTAANGNISSLQSDNAKIINLLSDSAGIGSLSSDTVSANYAALMHGQLGDAQIGSLSVGKLLAGDISTTKFRLVSDSGNIVMADNTVQVKDSTRTRVQLGKDGNGDYNIYVWDASGNLMFDATGLHPSGIKSGIIRDSMVASDAAISGAKIDQESLLTRINGATTLLNSSRVKYDPTGQTLTAEFQSLTTTVNSQGSTLSTQGTSISAIQGQITNKVWTSDITSAVNAYNTNTVQPLVTRVSSAEQKITPAAITSTVASNITGNQIASIINQSATTVFIDASKINLNGFVTLTQLSTPGATTISGSNIDTTTLRVQKIYNATGSDYGQIGSFDFTDIRGTRSYSGLEFYGGDGYSGGIYSQKDAGAGATWESMIISPVRNNYASLYASVRDTSDGTSATVSRGTVNMFAGDSSDSSNWASITATCDVPNSPRIQLAVTHDAGNMSAMNYINITSAGIELNGPLPTSPLDAGAWSNENSVYWDAKVTRIGNMCFIRGNITGSAASAGTVLMHIPFGFRPLKRVSVNTYYYNPNINIRLDITPAGELVLMTAITYGGWLGLQLFYAID